MIGVSAWVPNDSDGGHLHVPVKELKLKNISFNPYVSSFVSEMVERAGICEFQSSTLLRFGTRV